MSAFRLVSIIVCGCAAVLNAVATAQCETVPGVLFYGTLCVINWALFWAVVGDED